MSAKVKPLLFEVDKVRVGSICLRFGDQTKPVYANPFAASFLCLGEEPYSELLMSDIFSLEGKKVILLPYKVDALNNVVDVFFGKPGFQSAFSMSITQYEEVCKIPDGAIVE